MAICSASGWAAEYKTDGGDVKQFPVVVWREVDGRIVVGIIANEKGALGEAQDWKGYKGNLTFIGYAREWELD